MPSFRVETAQRSYDAVVERGVLRRISEFVPAKAGKLFIVTTADVWSLYGAQLAAALYGRTYEPLFFPGGEQHKRIHELEALAEQMVEHGADRSSVVIAFGGGIVNDVGGFLASVFMRGLPVVQVPTTLLAQVDAAVGGKTGVNLVAGKNLVGTFHQPLAVLIDPDVLRSLPEREFRAGLFEVVKCGVIRDRELFELLESKPQDVLTKVPAAVDACIEASVRIKAEVVTADEREGDLRRILNFGHTFGHALEAETHYTRFLHGEAVAFGMQAATHLAESMGLLSSPDAARVHATVTRYGPLPSFDHISVDALFDRLRADKKTVQGTVHFVLPVAIGSVKIVTGADDLKVKEAIAAALEAER
jgi:3-dehydroquinate synthase